MELRQLRYVEAVARCGGFTRAAEDLRVAQPAVSAQVRLLERELGTSLFDRTTRRVEPTEAGHAFLARARRILAEVEAARGEVDDLTSTVRGDLRIGATPVLGPLDLPTLLEEYHRRHPAVRVRLRSGLVDGLLRDVTAGTLDVVLCPVHDELPATLVARRVAREQLVLVTAAGHALAGRVSAQLRDVADQPFVCLPEGSGLHRILTTAARQQGVACRIGFEVAEPALVRALVARGLGVAVLAASAARGDGPPVATYRLEPALRHPPIGLVRVRGKTLSPAVRAWTALVTATAGAAS
ncbi:MAG: LysR family transcriptional regulator [Nocardioidaceae bacterium]|nr:LysR family transcriptional regulator [Nocardioidaceae bacterium]